VYHNPDDYRPHVAPQQTLNTHFRAHGYFVAGAGKIYHGGAGRRAEWDDYGSQPNPPEGDALQRRNIGGLRWAQLLGNDDVLRDYYTVDYCLKQLEAAHERPFFLACGIFRPHLPWDVPKKYFDLHPLDQIQLPPYRDDDLTDLPPAALRMARADGDHARIQQAGAWKEAVQAYLASITYADAQLGRLLDGLEKCRYKGNTIIVLWGDHGWHLGEKHHWRKFALWEEATRAPLIWVVPGLTERGRICERPVDFLSIYPTLCELTGLPRPPHVEGVSLRPLLQNPDLPWMQPAVTTHGFQNHAVRSDTWRYIRYANGDEELYHELKDPYEWTNLAGDPQYAKVKTKLAQWLPQKNKQPEARRRTSANRQSK
jgi:arylsulfatase A-like enzyme